MSVTPIRDGIDHEGAKPFLDHLAQGIAAFTERFGHPPSVCTFALMHNDGEGIKHAISSEATPANTLTQDAALASTIAFLMRKLS
jgi:hypothetical protein